MLKPCQLDQGAVVSTQQKAVASVSPASTTIHAATQTELWWDWAASQVSTAGCALLLGESWWQQHQYSCGTCAQREELLHFGPELQQEVNRGRSIQAH